MQTASGVLMLAALLLNALPGQVDTETVRLSVGQQKVLPAGSATKVLAGNPAVLTVRKLDNHRILLYGREPGTSEVTVVHAKGTTKYIVTVESNLAEKFQAECGALMGEPCSFLTAAVASGKVVVTGVVTDVETYHKLRKIRQAFPEAHYLVEVQPQVLDVLIPIINQQFQKSGLKNARVVRLGNRLVIEGLVENEKEKRRAELIVQEYYGEVTGE